MSMQVLFAGVRVRELGPAVGWWTRLFGRAPDVVPHETEVMWRVTDGGWLYVLEDASGAGHSLVTIAVSDLGAAVAEIAERGIAMGPIEAVGDDARKATAEDPDGNSLALIEVVN